MLCRRKALLNAFRSNSFNAIRGITSLEHPVKPYYITTPIFYPNAAPHIGHLYSLVTADIFARFHRLSDPKRPVHFVTGTDEHGLKIQRASGAAGMDPLPFCDKLSQNFRDLTEQANISNTRFIRTTETAHHEAAQDIWRRLYEKGLIYKGKHAGWYSVSDECFYTEAQITEVNPVDGSESTYYISTETGARVEWMQEENYMFKLSSFRERLLEHLERTPDYIYPPSRQQEVVEYLTAAPLEDLSISRLSSRLSWGIPVPGDSEHTMYVWFEALLSYMTGVGYPWPESANATSVAWPPHTQVIGKDIVRFHAVYFPAILMALEIPIPKHLLAHSHWTIDKKKMSKSVGNVVNPIEAMSLYHPDVVRFYLARVSGRFHHDVDWSQFQLDKHAAEIMSALGNFYSRCTSHKLRKGLNPATLPTVSELSAAASSGTHIAGAQILTELAGLRERTHKRLSEFEMSGALKEILQVLSTANSIFTELTPWRPDTDLTLRAQMYVITLETLRVCGILLQPYMPGKTTQLLDALRVPAEQRTWDFAEVGRGENGIGERPKSITLFPPATVAQKGK